MKIRLTAPSVFKEYNQIHLNSKNDKVFEYNLNLMKLSF